MSKIVAFPEQTEPVEDWDDIDTPFDLSLIAKNIEIAMAIMPDNPDVVMYRRRLNEASKTSPNLLIVLAKGFSLQAYMLYILSKTGQEFMELPNGQDIDTEWASELLLEGAWIITELLEGRLTV